MPQFTPNEGKVAIATFPVKPAGLACTAELWLGSDLTKVATSGEIPFTSTGASQSINLPITMPGVEGTYPVYLDVFVAGQLIGSYRAIEDVVIVPVGVAEFVYVSGIRFDNRYPYGASLHVEIDVQNVGNAAGVCSLVVHWNARYAPPGGGWWGWIGASTCFYETVWHEYYPCLFQDTLEPGEVKTFFYDWIFPYIADRMHVYFTGSPGTSPMIELRHSPRQVSLDAWKLA